MRDLLAALRSLPVSQREALLLVCVEQLTYAECADALSIPIGTQMLHAAGIAWASR
mgnify:CR=1 FL=1